MLAEGMEYQLVLRGDPVSGTTLLSTSIRTAILLRRILDPSSDPSSQGAYGSRDWRFQVIYGLLWPRGNILRSRALSSYNPFTTLPDTDRELLLDVSQVNERQVWLHAPNWREQVEEAFQHVASVSLIALPEAKKDLKSAVLGLVAEPIELGFLQVYPQVEGVQRHARGFAVRLRVREALQ